MSASSNQMSAGSTTAARSKGSSLSLVAFIVVVAYLAAIGVANSVGALISGHADGDHGATSTVGAPVVTTFGTVTVETFATLPGLTSQDLGGVTHGIQNLVLSDSAQVELSVAIVNASGGAVAIDPAQFRLHVAGTAEPIEPTGATIHPLRLGPNARVEATLTFVVPRTSSAITVDYVDPASGEPLTLAEGTVDEAPADAAGGHPH